MRPFVIFAVCGSLVGVHGFTRLPPSPPKHVCRDPERFVPDAITERACFYVDPNPENCRPGFSHWDGDCGDDCEINGEWYAPGHNIGLCYMHNDHGSSFPEFGKEDCDLSVATYFEGKGCHDVDLIIEENYGGDLNSFCRSDDDRSPVDLSMACCDDGLSVCTELAPKVCKGDFNYFNVAMSYCQLPLSAVDTTNYDFEDMCRSFGYQLVDWDDETEQYKRCRYPRFDPMSREDCISHFFQFGSEKVEFDSETCQSKLLDLMREVESDISPRDLCRDRSYDLKILQNQCCFDEGLFCEEFLSPVCAQPDDFNPDTILSTSCYLPRQEWEDEKEFLMDLCLQVGSGVYNAKFHEWESDEFPDGQNFACFIEGGIMDRDTCTSLFEGHHAHFHEQTCFGEVLEFSYLEQYSSEEDACFSESDRFARLSECCNGPSICEQYISPICEHPDAFDPDAILHSDCALHYSEYLLVNPTFDFLAFEEECQFSGHRLEVWDHENSLDGRCVADHVESAEQCSLEFPDQFPHFYSQTCMGSFTSWHYDESPEEVCRNDPHKIYEHASKCCTKNMAEKPASICKPIASQICIQSEDYDEHRAGSFGCEVRVFIDEGNDGFQDVQNMCYDLMGSFQSFYDDALSQMVVTCSIMEYEMTAEECSNSLGTNFDSSYSHWNESCMHLSKEWSWIFDGRSAEDACRDDGDAEIIESWASKCCNGPSSCWDPNPNQAN